MTDLQTGWHPSVNPVHRLVDLLDVLAIGLNRFMDASFGLPHPTSPGYTPTARHERLTRLRCDYRTLCDRIFPPADIGHHVTAEWLAGEAVAYFARHGCDEGKAVSRRAASVLFFFGSLRTPTPDPSSSLPHFPAPDDEGGWDDQAHEQYRVQTEYHETESANFERQYQLLQEYQAVRKGLIDSLRDCGWSIPPDIHRRSGAAAVPADNPHVRDITFDALIELIDQTKKPGGRPLTSGDGGLQPEIIRAKMSPEEADRKAKELTGTPKKKEKFLALSERGQAKQIGCSWGTYSKTDFYADAKRRGWLGGGKKPGAGTTGRTPSIVRLTSELESSIGEGERDEVLTHLAAAEDAEPKSPQWEDLPPDERRAILAAHEADDASDPSPVQPRSIRRHNRNRP